MKLAIGFLISFAVGVFCRVFDIPVGSPPVIPGAILVLAMTLGYSSTNTLLNRHNKPATTMHLCGGPSGLTAKQTQSPSNAADTVKAPRAASLDAKGDSHA